ncbi:MAG: collagen-like protein, partial [Sphingobacteriales bacterium]
MKYSILIAALIATIGLTACEKKTTVIEAPAAA